VETAVDLYKTCRTSSQTGNQQDQVALESGYINAAKRSDQQNSKMAKSRSEVTAIPKLWRRIEMELK
jgi:hypothetical protein